jgi:hypothetical protein
MKLGESSGAELVWPQSRVAWATEAQLERIAHHYTMEVLNLGCVDNSWESLEPASFKRSRTLGPVRTEPEFIAV